jgi:SNW domain-containing protein 1
MANSLKQYLPSPVNQHSVSENAPLYPQKASTALLDLNKKIPPYGGRKGWIPKTVEDFGDGGSFPEIHVLQYPLNMGKKGVDKSIVTLGADSTGKAQYDAVVKQGHHSDVVVWSKAGDIKEKNFSEEQLQRPTEEEDEETLRKTKELLEGKLAKKIAAKDPTSKTGQNAKYIRYTPSTQGPEFNSGASQRIVRLVEMPKDPLEPPKFKYQKAPPVPGSPPVPVLHSPPKKLSKDERDAWKIPPCISNWKNPKGYIISLDKRLATDGRDLQENTISDSFAYFSDALNIAEQKARDEVTKRLNINRELEIQRQKEREEELSQIAEQARLQRAAISTEAIQNESRQERIERIERERIREERRLEREREHRLAQRGRESKKTKTSRDYQRDISEKLALGEAVPRTVESMFDSRLFNQTQGMDSGFGGDDSYNVYDKRLFGDEREKALSRATTKDRQDDEGHYDERSNKKRDLQWDREDDTGGEGRGKEREKEGRTGKDHEYHARDREERGEREREGRGDREKEGRGERERESRGEREREGREGRDGGRDWESNKRQRK